jgi:hypothetical protein
LVEILVIRESSDVTRRWLIWIVLAVLGLLGIAGAAWYFWAVDQGAYLLEARVEAERLCRSVVEEQICPLESPVDPWGERYFCDRGSDGVFTIRTLGRDLRPGGEDDASDVVCRSMEDGCACDVVH